MKPGHPLTIDEWKLIAIQTIIARDETQKLLQLVSGKIRGKLLKRIMAASQHLAMLRYELESQMFYTTGINDLSIFDPEVRK